MPSHNLGVTAASQFISFVFQMKDARADYGRRFAPLFVGSTHRLQHRRLDRRGWTSCYFSVSSLIVSNQDEHGSFTNGPPMSPIAGLTVFSFREIRSILTTEWGRDRRTSLPTRGGQFPKLSSQVASSTTIAAKLFW